MKKYIYFTILLLVFSTFAYTQIINFADSNFKNVLLSTTSTGNSAGTGAVVYNASQTFVPQSFIAVDANSDGEIQQSEALTVTYLSLAGNNIANMGGIEYFTNLKYINLVSNPLTSINLSALTQLETLIVAKCNLTSIDLTGLVSLRYFNFWMNQITTIDFSGLPNLKRVYCPNNLVSSLDFTNNPLFDDLVCTYNPNLTSIKIKNGAMQLFPDSNHCLFDGNPNLHYICADVAEIPVLQSFQATCDINNTCVIDSACVLGVEGFNVNEVSVFPNPTYSKVYFDNTNYSFNAVSIYNYLGQEVATSRFTSFGANQEIDLSALAKGVYILKFKGNQESQSVKIIKQ